MPHIYEMGAHLAVSQSSLGPNGHIFWSVDHRSVHLGLYLPRVNSSFDAKVGSRMKGYNLGAEEAMAPPRQPWGQNQDIYQVLASCLLLV